MHRPAPPGWMSILLLGIVATAASTQSVASPKALPRPAIGKPAPTFELVDLKGQKHRPADARARPPAEKGQVVVLIWWAATAPVAAKTDPEVCAVHKAFAARGVRFFAINPFLDPGPDLAGAEIRQLAVELKRLRGIAFPVLVDTRREVSRRFGARRIPEAVVIDRQGVIRYRGAIVTPLVRPGERKYRRYLHEALEAVVTGKKVATPETPVWGTEIPYFSKSAKGGKKEKG